MQKVHIGFFYRMTYNVLQTSYPKEELTTELKGRKRSNRSASDEEVFYSKGPPNTEEDIKDTAANKFI